MRRQYIKNKRERNSQQLSQASSYYNDRYIYVASLNTQPKLYYHYVPSTANTDSRTVIIDVTHQVHSKI